METGRGTGSAPLVASADPSTSTSGLHRGLRLSSRPGGRRTACRDSKQGQARDRAGGSKGGDHL